MGGVIGIASDLSGIQFRMLNKTRGEAVQGPRAQIDRDLNEKNIKKIISDSGVSVIEGEVIDIVTEKKAGKEYITGIEIRGVGKLNCKKLVVTGTFLSGLIYRGNKKWKAGRLNAKPHLIWLNFVNNQLRHID